MKGSDIKISPKTKKGVIALKKYLDFAEKGILADFGAVSGKEPDSDFEIAVMDLLDRYGYKTAPQVGVAGFFIDIGVYNPYRENEFLCGIECDGATYHSMKSIKDRDVLRQQILESKGWNIYRIWSTDWFKNRDRERDRLSSFLKQLAEESKLSRHKQSANEEIQEYIEDAQSQDISLKKISDAISDYSPDQELRESLLEYRQKKMSKEEMNSAGCILSNTMINILLATMPVSSNEFLSKIPLGMRELIDSEQGKYLPEILNIIKEFADL